MVARKLLLLLLFAFQTWIPAEALYCYNSVRQASSMCESTSGYCYVLISTDPYMGEFSTTALACDPDDSSFGLSPNEGLAETCRDIDKKLETKFVGLYYATGFICFHIETIGRSRVFCFTKNDRGNSAVQAEQALRRYLKDIGEIPVTYRPLPRVPTTKSTTTTPTTTTTTPTTTTTTPTTTTTTPTTTTTTPSTTTTTPTTTPTTTSPPTTTTSPPTTTTSPPTTTTSPTPKPKPTTTQIKTTTTSIKPKPSSSNPVTNTVKSTTTAFNPTMTLGSTVNTEDYESPAPEIHCNEKENMGGSTDGGQLCDGRFCLIAIGSNDSYASGCADSSGMVKVNEMLDSPFNYSTFCQDLYSDSEEACVRCEDRKTKSGSGIKICCTNKEQSNTLDTVKKNVTCKPATSKDQPNEKSSLIIVIVVIVLVVLFLIILVIVIVIVVRKKNEKPKKKKNKKKGKKGGKKGKKPEKSGRTIDSRSLPTDNTTVGLVNTSLSDFSTTVGTSPTIGGTSTIGGSPTTTTGTVDDPISKKTIGNTTSDNTTGGNISLPMEYTNPNTTTSTIPSAKSKQTGGAKIAKSSTPSKNIAKSSTPDKKIAKSSTPNKKIAKSSTKSKKPATRKPSTATTKTSQGNSKQTSEVASTFAL